LLIVPTVGLVLVLAFIAVFPTSPLFRAGLVGALIVAWLWVVTFALFVVSGVSARLLGVWAEDAVEDDLRREQRRGRLFGVVRGVRFERFDIDVVAVAASGVLAVEVNRRSQSRNDTWKYAALDQARRSGRTLKRFLDSKGVGASVEVFPVLVILGSALEPLDLPPQGKLVGDVLVVSGLDTAWIERYREGLVGPDHGSRIAAAVADFAAERDTYEWHRTRKRLRGRLGRS
jgi:hypothetical protein